MASFFISCYCMNVSYVCNAYVCDVYVYTYIVLWMTSSVCIMFFGLTLYIGSRPCDLSPIHFGVSIGAVLGQLLFRQLYKEDVMGITSDIISRHNLIGNSLILWLSPSSHPHWAQCSLSLRCKSALYLLDLESTVLHFDWFQFSIVVSVGVWGLNSPG